MSLVKAQFTVLIVNHFPIHAKHLYARLCGPRVVAQVLLQAGL